MGDLKRLASLVATLGDMGWTRSASERRPVSAAGTPVPWWTIAATEFLAHRIAPGSRAFEWGAGQSSLWLAERVARLTSVEHVETFANELRALAPSNLDVVSVPAEVGEYVGAMPEEDRFDLVVVDGLFRVECFSRAIDQLDHAGFVVVDNIDRPSLASILTTARARSMERLDFLGPVLGSGRLSVTSLFGYDLGPLVGQHPAVQFRGY